MPKTKFIIYKYSFLKEENLFTKKNDTKEEAINKALETFSSLFESKSLDVYHSKTPSPFVLLWLIRVLVMSR